MARLSQSCERLFAALAFLAALQNVAKEALTTADIVLRNTLSVGFN